MRRRLLTLGLAFMVLLGAMLPVYADVEAKQMRHSVVCVQIGAQGNAGYLGFFSGTGFFVGEEGKDPSYLLTNYHVVEDFLALGSGQENDFSTFFFWYLSAVEGLSERQIQAIINDDDQRNKLVNAVGNQIWTKFAGTNLNSAFRMVVRVYFDDNDVVEAYVVDNGNRTKDMALLRIEKPTDKRVPLKISIPTEDMVGHSVTAIGYPGASNRFIDPVSARGESDSTVTVGTVSRLGTETGTGRRIVQYDASINHGNSGGPLILNETGAAIALNTWGTSEDSNMSFGVSMEEVIPMLKNNNVSFELVEYPEPTEEPTPEPTEEPTPEPTEEPTPEPTAEPTPDPGHPAPVVNGKLIVGIAAVAIAIAAVVVIRNKQPKPEPTPRPTPGPAPSPAVKQNPDDSLFRIQCIRGVQGNKRVMIPISGQVVMGRNPDCGIVFPTNTKGVSGKHCAIYHDNGSVYIKDLGSSYGTFIDPGQKLTAHQAVQIPVGKKFWLGSENESFVIEKKA